VARVLSTTRPPRRHTRKLLAAVLIVVVVAGLGVAADLGYSSLKSRASQLQANLTAYLQAGQRELEAGKSSLKLANSKHDVKLVADAVVHFDAAAGHFIAARQLADSSRLLKYLEIAPAVGDTARSSHAAVDAIAEMGAAISAAGHELSALDGHLLKPAAGGPAGRTLLTALNQAQASLVKVRADLVRAQKAAASVDVRVVPEGQQGTLLKARDTITVALAGLDEFERLVPVLTEVLGGNGARTYLIEQVNPAELRAGGGFIGTYSLLRADHGTLTVIKSGDAYNLADPRPSPGQPGFIPQPTPYREIIPNTSWSFVDSNIYPDFASNGLAAEHFVQPRVGVKVDGVISMDYYTVAKMLELTGPIAVPGFGTTLSATTFVPQIVAADIAGSAFHKAILAAVAGPLMQRVSALPPDRWPALITDLNTLAGQRHLQVYFNNGVVNSEIDRVGWSGALNPTSTQDYMMEVESNYYGDKVNYFLTRHYSVIFTRQGAKLHHQVTVDFVNSTRCFSYDRTSYKANLRLFVGANASALKSNLIPVKYRNPAPPTGARALDGWQPDVLCAGGRGRAVFQFDTPWAVHDRGLAQIYWQKQPGTLNDRIDVTWIDGNGHTYKMSGNLSQDRIISLSPNGVTLLTGRPAQATLPSLSLG
jgi:hypothetical protein